MKCKEAIKRLNVKCWNPYICKEVIEKCRTKLIFMFLDEYKDIEKQVDKCLEIEKYMS